jgi:hypothetical protein
LAGALLAHLVRVETRGRQIIMVAEAVVAVPTTGQAGVMDLSDPPLVGRVMEAQVETRVVEAVPGGQGALLAQSGLLDLRVQMVAVAAVVVMQQSPEMP